VLVVATSEEASGEIGVFAVNRSLSEPVENTVDLRLVGGLALSQHLSSVRRRPVPDPLCRQLRHRSRPVDPRFGTVAR